jgi:hypothetical protein
MKSKHLILFSLFIAFANLNAVNRISKKSDRGGNLITQSWHPYYDLNTASFQNAVRKYGPFTRWWWPGNDVSSKELQREIRVFKENGFAGVEIQPIASGFNPKGSDVQINRQLSWDSPTFYMHLRSVMKQAKKSGVIVDLNAGSGWPIGGPQVNPDSSLLTLAYTDTLVNGESLIQIQIPKLKQSKFNIRPGRAQFSQTVSVKLAKLQAVIVGRVISENGQITIDESSLQNITPVNGANTLSWNAPKGKWKILAFYSIPDGEFPKAIASNPKGYVVDHLDSTKIFNAYNYLLGKRTGLQPFFKHPLRAVFNDSYEFMPHRHYSNDFLSFFKERRGYDVSLYLPVNMKPCYNNAYVAPFYTNMPFDFSYSKEDWRIRYDYDLTISELLVKHFIKASDSWLNKQSLLHRTQAYGVRMDIIAASGAADIPEAEQLAGDNSEGFVKLVSSGAHLYNKPIISQESFVFREMAETTTPQKLRVLVDKSFAAGVNQIFYHGSPYKYQTGEYGKEGWMPMSTPFESSTFSSTINESSPFWVDIKIINQYIARSQYVLQSGKHTADVLIYFPFNDFIPDQISVNPKEILTQGRFKGIEPNITLKIPSSTEIVELPKIWFQKIWPLINALEAKGITWDFVNDESVNSSKSDNGKINIRGNLYSTLIVANAPYIQLSTAEKISELARRNMNLFFYGELPTIQPSYFNYKENDRKTSLYITEALQQPNSKQIKDEAGVNDYLSNLNVNLKFAYGTDSVRTTERKMNNGTLVKFIWNMHNQKQTVNIVCNGTFKNYYWMDAVTGSIEKNTGSTVSYTIAPYCSVFLMATNENVPENKVVKIMGSRSADAIKELRNWDIKIGNVRLYNSPLFDWRTNDSLMYKSDIGVYSTSFNIYNIGNDKKYMLDLGTVYYDAEVFLNGKNVGKKMWMPYEFDITSLLQIGKNMVEIRVTPTLRNEFIGEGLKGNPKYLRFKDQAKTILATGLIGPVKINEVLTY